MCALADDPFPHSRQSVEDDGARATSDIVYGLAGETDADGRRDGQPVDIPERVGVELCHGGLAVWARSTLAAVLLWVVSARLER